MKEGRRLHVFDAGTRGCADGLAAEFKRRLGEIPVGESLQVVVRDPAAKADLPALARLLGQTVMAVEEHQDGRLIINVEKTKWAKS
jgi:TusA-related sulfurtransferase